MAPKKPTPTERLVAVITNLEQVVLKLQDKLESCKTTIDNQQGIITSLGIKIDQNTQALKEYMNVSTNCKSTLSTATESKPEKYSPKQNSASKSKDMITGVNVPRILLVNSFAALDDSGPEGITSHHDIQVELNEKSSPEFETPTLTLDTSTSPSTTTGNPWKRVGSRSSPPPTKGLHVQVSKNTAACQGPAFQPAAGGRLINHDHHKHDDQQDPKCSGGVGLRAGPPRVSSLHLFNFSSGTVPVDITNHLKSHLSCYLGSERHRRSGSQGNRR
ncbi:hypothetical protein O0L34_g6242 [Tuta absoluta]|nr:hypothetical protein O0L34_g6242 [Tuta absoluta]